MNVPRLRAWVFRSADELRRAVEFVGGGTSVPPVQMPELLPVSTCQRHELFILADEPIAPLSDVIRTFENADAALRLFEITAGVSSEVPGEEAVAAQVRRAIRQTLRNGLARSTMAKLVRRALRAGEALRNRVRETTPILELPDLVGELVSGRVVLLGAGALGRSIHQTLTSRDTAPAVWATRSPRSNMHTTIPIALRTLRKGDTLISALAGVQRPIEIDVDGVDIIDLGQQRSVRHASRVPSRGNVWALADVIARSRECLTPQADAVARAAHRLPAIAEAALAECLCPSIKSLNRAINEFRKNIIDAEMKRLEPLLAEIDQSQGDIIKRSIMHTAARTAHPLHEYVNALGRQGRVDDARLLIDHILGSRIGIQTGGGGVSRPRKREGTS